MKVLVYGAGAVGLGVSSCLIEAGVSVSIVAREKSVAELAAQGLRRTGIFGSRRHAPDSFRVASNLDPFLANSFDYVLICTKSFDTAAAAADLSRLAARPATDLSNLVARPRSDVAGAVRPTAGAAGAAREAAAGAARPTTNATVPVASNTTEGHGPPLYVLFQNGWGNREVFANYVRPEIVCNARVITGFSRTSPAEVKITVHADDIHIGFFGGGREREIEPLCKMISAGGVPCSFTNSIVEDLWAKMLYNCSLNSLGAIFETNYGTLAAKPASRELLDLIIEECFSVMTGAGYKTHWKTAAAYRDFFYGTLIPATGDHYPSTLQDIRAGKKTEVEALNGAVVRLAEENGMKAPYNRMAYSMVKYKEIT